MDSPAIDPSKLFLPPTPLNLEWLTFVKKLPQNSDRIDFQGKTNYDNFGPGGIQFIKCEDIFVDPDSNTTFGPPLVHANCIYPKAFFIICKNLVFRPTPQIPIFNFAYSTSDPGIWEEQPYSNANGGHVGSDGRIGTSPWPQNSLEAYKGIPIYIFLQKVRLDLAAPPDLKLVEIVAMGDSGRDGEPGQSSGGCSGGPCRQQAGRGGDGGAGASGFGAPHIFVYGPEVEIDRFYTRTTYRRVGGLGGRGGAPGKPSDGVNPQLSNRGIDGQPGSRGDFTKIIYNNVVDLFT